MTTHNEKIKSIDISSFNTLQKGVVEFEGKLYLTAARIAEYGLFEGLRSRAGVFKRAKKDKWESVKVPYQGRAEGAEHFLIAEDKAQLYRDINRNTNLSTLTGLLGSESSTAVTPFDQVATSNLNQWLLLLCYNAYKSKYSAFESAHITQQLKVVTSFYNCLNGINGVLSLGEYDYKSLNESDISNYLDLFIKLGKADKFVEGRDYQKELSNINAITI